MRRTSMRKQPPERVRTVHTPGTGRGAMQRVGDEVVSVPKDAPVRSEAYRRLVASQPCWMCSRMGPSQCAHADQGKGMSIKACDLQTFPLCADAPSRVGCHTSMGASGNLDKETRRSMERAAVADTQRALTELAAYFADVRKVLRDVGLLP